MTRRTQGVNEVPDPASAAGGAIGGKGGTGRSHPVIPDGEIEFLLMRARALADVLVLASMSELEPQKDTLTNVAGDLLELLNAAHHRLFPDAAAQACNEVPP
ncbi:MAG: hypothetical protein ACREPL_15670 [Rhodanobacteraceae bacterium]